jgi:hypothetical protein
MSDEPQYEKGDVRVVELGEFTTRDGRTIHGALIDFPAGPPPLPLSVIFNGTPLTLAIKPQPAR